MNRIVFEARHEADWDRLERLLRVPEKLTTKGRIPSGSLAAPPFPEDVADLPALHRRICHHLALARHRHYGPDLEQRLNALALAAHDRLYRRRSPSLSEVAHFIISEFPRRVRKESRLVLLAAALLVLPALILFAGSLADPELAATVLPPSTASSLAEPFSPGGMSLRSGQSDIAMFGFYVRNNVGIAFRSFGSGLFFGVGAIIFLVYNGLFFGAFAGEISNLGYEKNFYSFVCGHGSFELTALVLAGAAGLRIGFALLVPGSRRRLAALREEARESLTLVGGAAVYLVVAAAIEAFWSGSPVVPSAVKFGAGGALWILVVSHLLLGGRPRGS